MRRQPLEVQVVTLPGGAEVTVLQTTKQLSHYRNLTPRWASWSAIVEQCKKIADAMLTVP